jgi:tetratricopeptide (TPR) repeat protein
MLETVREFAAEQLVQAPEAADLRMRHARFFLALAEHVESRPGTADRSTWLDRLEAERDNCRAALEWAAASDDPELELRLLAALREFWEARGPVGEGHAAAALGDAERAHACIEEAVAVAHASADPTLVSRALINFGALVYAEGDFQRAAELTEESLGVGGTGLEPRLRAIALNNLAEARLSIGQRDETVEDPAREVLELTPEHGDLQLVASSLETLAILEAQRDRQRAARLLGGANAVFETLGVDLDAEAMALVLDRADETVERAYGEGRELQADAAIEYALGAERSLDGRT